MTEQQLEIGSPHATEFNKMLASDMPLIDVLRQWDRTVGPSIPMDTVIALTPADAAAFGIVMYENWDTYVIDPVRAADPYYESRDRIMHDCWVKLENIRATLRQASA